MDFDYTPDDEAFRAEVRKFLKQHLPKKQSFEAIAEWQKQVRAKGWVGFAWPREVGGGGGTIAQQVILKEEMAKAHAPALGSCFMGLAWVGPSIIEYGTEEQKQKFIPDILDGKYQWCTGYSEPGSGSDLAALKTRALRDGDDYVVNGQKIWTSIAHLARWMILLARTDPDAPKHKGITYFLMDMKSPGVETRPLTNLAGGREFSEVFLENVRIPKSSIIGEENRGWYSAVTTLDFERSAIGSAVGMRQSVEDLVRYAKEHSADSTSTLAQNPMLRYELADRLTEAEVGRMLSYRIVSLQAKGLIPNYEASIVKLYNMELNQRIARTGMHVLGMYGQLDRGSKWAPLRGRLKYMYLRSLGSTIEGGTSEIQRNIVATRGLNLPRGD
jgi:hypothetical protein